MNINRTPEYQAWANIYQRCNNPLNPGFHRYGGRGITLHPDWRKPKDFIAAVGLRPYPGMWIDRIDNNGNYEPGNVRWTTPKVQCNNRNGSLKLIEINGIKNNITDWAKHLGIARETLRKRLKVGIPAEIAISHKIKYVRRKGLIKVQELGYNPPQNA